MAHELDSRSFPWSLWLSLSLSLSLVWTVAAGPVPSEVVKVQAFHTVAKAPLPILLISLYCDASVGHNKVDSIVVPASSDCVASFGLCDGPCDSIDEPAVLLLIMTVKDQCQEHHQVRQELEERWEIELTRTKETFQKGERDRETERQRGH